MKTEPRRPLVAVRDDLLLSEEVLLHQPHTQQRRRVMLPFALVFMANAVRAKVPFELRRLDDTLLAQFNGSELEARSEIAVSLPPVGIFLEQFSQAIADQLLERLRAHRPSGSGESPST